MIKIEIVKGAEVVQIDVTSQVGKTEKVLSSTSLSPGDWPLNVQINQDGIRLVQHRDTKVFEFRPVLKKVK